jgi:uncharacterized membrane protein YoaK (UPF0700 family)
MAFLAGATDVYGLAHLHDLFVSFMSGNTTLLGAAIGQADWPRVAAICGLVATFLAGAAGGTVLGTVAGRWHRVAVIVAVALLLAMASVLPSWETMDFVLAMGAINASMNRVGSVAISLTYVTGTLVKFGQGIGHALCGQLSDLGWLWQAPMWLSLLAGAVAATLARHSVGEAVWPLPALAGLLAVAALVQGPEVEPVRAPDGKP